MHDLQAYLEASASRHRHLCPRQVLGVRAAMAGTNLLNLDVPRVDKRLMVIVETDGCFTDGIEVVTGVAVGHRTLRIEDIGKIAATFIDVKKQTCFRISPHLDIRQRVWDYVQGERRHYFAQLDGYQVMPDEALLKVEEVALATPLERIISRAGIRTKCDLCGEDIINQREIRRGNEVLCKSCAGGSYYISLTDPRPDVQEEGRVKVIDS